MNARHEQNLETARSQVTGTAPAAAEKKKRTRSPGVVAGALYQKLCELDAEEEAELAASPESIRAKFAARREKALEGVSEDVIELVWGGCAAMKGLREVSSQDPRPIGSLLTSEILAVLQARGVTLDPPLQVDPHEPVRNADGTTTPCGMPVRLGNGPGANTDRRPIGSLTDAEIVEALRAIEQRLSGIQATATAEGKAQS